MFDEALLKKIRIIKDNISIRDILNLYGIKVVHNKCVCPLHIDSCPSMLINRNNTFYCFGCGQKGDVIDLFKGIENISTYQAVENLIKHFNLGSTDINSVDYRPRLILPKLKPKKENFKNPKIVNYILACQKCVEQTDYFKNRGLLPYIINRFRLGFDDGTIFAKYFPNFKRKRKNVVVIPYNRALTYYQDRNINEKMFYKTPVCLAGSEPVFNANVFAHSPIVFVVESPICAMSITQCGGQSVALCGVGNVSHLLEYLGKHYYSGILVICLDNDIAGQNATKELINGNKDHRVKGLNDLKINYLVENIADECNDPNELLQKNWHRLRINVQRVILRIKRK